VWPGGTRDVLRDVAAGRYYRVREGAGLVSRSN